MRGFLRGLLGAIGLNRAEQSADMEAAVRRFRLRLLAMEAGAAKARAKREKTSKVEACKSFSAAYRKMAPERASREVKVTLWAD